MRGGTNVPRVDRVGSFCRNLAGIVGHPDGGRSCRIATCQIFLKRWMSCTLVFEHDTNLILVALVALRPCWFSAVAANIRSCSSQVAHPHSPLAPHTFISVEQGQRKSLWLYLLVSSYQVPYQPSPPSVRSVCIPAPNTGSVLLIHALAPFRVPFISVPVRRPSCGAGRGGIRSPGGVHFPRPRQRCLRWSATSSQ